jgi:hypothetical protein
VIERFDVPALLKSEKTEQMQGIEMLRLRSQRRPVVGLSFVELATLMELQP